jgi:DNA ligase (NAD+)
LKVRGEIYMDKGDFAELNRIRDEEGEPLLANPRNAAAGAIRMKDPKLVSARRLRAIIYQVVRADGMRISSQSDAYELLRGLHFPVNPERKICAGLDEVIEVLEDWRGKRHELSFEIDGIVVKVNDRELQGELGQTSRSPRWAVAFKYPPEAAKTVIRSIGAQVGRTGAITPVAEFDAVHIGGSTVRRATLHNYDEVARKDIRIGDTVLVEKGGDVIPKVTEVVLSERPDDSIPIAVPESCPDLLPSRFTVSRKKSQSGAATPDVRLSFVKP